MLATPLTVPWLRGKEVVVGLEARRWGIFGGIPTYMSLHRRQKES